MVRDYLKHPAVGALQVLVDLNVKKHIRQN